MGYEMKLLTLQMDKKKKIIGTALILIFWAGIQPVQAEDAGNKVTADDIVQRCNFKYPGDDQKSQLTTILRDKDGNEKKTVYRRYWKDYKNRDGVADKMDLFTEYPPDAQGVGFMRWAYTAALDKNPDQWVYLPVLKKIRRVSVRDPGDSFLGSDLTHFDISGRQLVDTDNTILQAVRRGNEDVFVVRSVPRDKAKALYGGYITTFVKATGPDWDSCLTRQMEYFDKHGEPLKKQSIKWQKVGKAWVWDEVLVVNTQTGHSSLFKISDVQINVGLKDDIFTERNLMQEQ